MALQDLLSSLVKFLPLLVTIAVVIVGLWLVDMLIKRRARIKPGERQFGGQITMILLTIVGLVIVVLTVPTSDETRTQLLSLMGVALTAVIALSSTTFVSNAMAGILLRSMSRFKPGDFIRVGETVGRVTERGLFHTEVQTEDRDLATFPNYYLVSNPIKVVRSSGTIISATVSLGYDVPHDTVRSRLTQAAEEAGLQDPFAHVMSLGDFSITYRIAGFLEDVKRLITAPSTLRRCMLDALHGAGIEIVSPTFMIQRQQKAEAQVIAERAVPTPAEADGEPNEVVVMFDKAEAASKVEELKQERETLGADIDEMKKELTAADDEARPRLERGLRYREDRLEKIAEAISSAEEALEG